MNFHLYFDAIEKEVQKKNESMLNISSFSEEQFDTLCLDLIESKDIGEIKSACEFAMTLKSIDQNHPSSKAYYIHAIRVATHVLASLVPADIELTKTALIHNAFEISGVSSNKLLNSGFSEFSVDAIQLQTVDRSRQFDEDYLRIYYQDIEKFSKRLVLLRCLDKLDNLLAFELIPNGDLRTNWLKNTEDYVLPMAKSIDRRFGQYFYSTLEYIKDRGCIDELREEYDNLQKLRRGKNDV